ncbi:MAG: aspartyl protease family protein [Candidatus Gracilibacteria bacterium]|jgi:hypothetical protein
MEQKSGKLIIDNNGKLILTGEVFDDHGSFDFNAFVDTGSSFGMVLTKQLADAVCAKYERDINISIGGGSNATTGQICRANLRFGDLTLQNYEVTVVNGNRNLVGIKFFQDTGIIILIDFHKGKTMGGAITTDRRFAKAIGKTSHCFFVHNNDITKSNEPCPICGAQGE